MQKPILLITILVITLTIALFVFIAVPKPKQKTETMLNEASSSMMPKRDPNIYKNTVYNYEVAYPFNLSFKESSPEAVLIGEINDLQTESKIELHVFFQPRMTQKTVTVSDVFAFDQAKKLCSATGPNTRIFCDSVEQLETFTSDNGTLTKSFYLTEKTVDQESGELKSTTLKGPFFVIDVSKNTPGTQSALLISPPVQKDPQQINAQLVRDVAQSVKLLPLMQSATPSAAKLKK